MVLSEVLQPPSSRVVTMLGGFLKPAAFVVSGPVVCFE